MKPHSPRGSCASLSGAGFPGRWTGDWLLLWNIRSRPWAVAVAWLLVGYWAAHGRPARRVSMDVEGMYACMYVCGCSYGDKEDQAKRLRHNY